MDSSLIESTDLVAPPGSVLPGWLDDHDGAVELSADGRVARRQLNRERVIDAYVGLMRDGVVNPSATEVGERAELTPRTVYRYLREDLTLKADVAQRLLSPLSSLASPSYLPSVSSPSSLSSRSPCDARTQSIDIEQSSLWDRIEAFVSLRLDLFDLAAPIVSAVGDDHVAERFVAAAMDAAHTAMSEQLSRVFAPELEQLSHEVRHADLIIVHALLLFDSLEYLYRHVGAEQVKAMLCRRVYAALTTAQRPALTPSH